MPGKLMQQQQVVSLLPTWKQVAQQLWAQSLRAYPG